ncbi:MAG: amidohydrolase [Phycisphaerales bacterium]|nr:amidohydrolase [Phycisphaerales bacterium]
MRPFTVSSLLRRSFFTLLTFLVAGACASGCAADSRRDMLVLNAHVWTASAATPEAEAFVVRDGRFIFVGAATDAKTIAGHDALVLDAHGRRIIPGIIDAHMHLLAGGEQIGHLNLRDATDRREFIASIEKAAGLLPEGEAWLLGGRWSTESWPDPTQPDRSWIDPGTAKTPALLYRMDGHAALVNTAALQLAGIDATGPADPPGGRIERDPQTNEPTGILKDSAIDLVAKHVPPATKRKLDAALVRAGAHALSHGVTCVHTMEDWQAFETFNRARRRDTLGVRVRQYLSEPNWIEMLPRVDASARDAMLRLVGFKEYADGSLGSRTAYMATPYTHTHDHNPTARGLLREGMLDQPRLERMCEAVYRAGYTPAIHAIGDEANHEVLDIYARICDRVRRDDGRVTKTGASRLAPRIEHAQHLLPGDIARFHSIPVTASMQPYHKADDGRYAEQAIGVERCRTSYAFRSLLDSGALVCFGSDWPVVSLNPFLGIATAVTGKTLDGRTFVPEQNIAVEEALLAYTAHAAEAAGDHFLGRIEKGCYADFVILDRDILTIPPSQIADTRVVATYVNGDLSFGSTVAN